MGKAKKATKKFLKNSLDKEYERRNKARPLKKAFAQRQKKKAEKANAPPKEDDGTGLPPALPIEEMDVDAFMASGFKDILNEGEISDDDDESEPMEGDDAEDEDDEDVADDKGPEDPENDVSDDEDTSLVRASNNAASTEIDSHKDSLDKLKAAQPEFYKFLQHNDKELLDFAEGSDLEDEEEQEGDQQSTTMQGDDDEEEDDDDEEEEEEAPTREEITLANARKLVAELDGKNKQKSFVALRKLIAAFKQIAAKDDEEDEDTIGDGPDATTQGYVIKSSFRSIPKYFDERIQVPNKAGRNPPLPVQSKQWKKHKAHVKAFLNSSLQFQTTVTDVSTAVFAMQCSMALCRYYACVPKLNRMFFKLMLSKWSHGAEEIRVNAFLVMRTMTIVSPYPFIEMSLKGTYLTFIRNCKFPTATMRPTLTFMLNAVVELYRLDESATYQHAFVYIRQLAVHLRNAIVSKKKDAYVQVYNWQFIYALRVWSKLLGEEATTNMEGLKALIYPFVQVVLGAMNLITSSRFAPHKFHCINMLIDLMDKTGVYIPLSAHILDCLDVAEMKRKPKPTTGKPLIFEAMLRVSKKQLPSPQFQDAVLKNALDCAVKYYGALATSISFPECVFPDTVRLRRYVKTCKAKHITKKLRVLLDKLDENSTFILNQRAQVNFSPKDVVKADAWAATLKQQGKSPLQRHYKVWLAADTNRRKLNEAVQDIEGDDFKKKDDDDDDEKDDDDDDHHHQSKSKKSKKQKKKAAAAVVPTDEEEDVAAADDDDDDDEEDVVGDFVMDDFELDSD